MSQSYYNTAAIRELLQNAFSDEEFDTFCSDYFPYVGRDFSTGMSKSAKIQRLLTYCNTRSCLPKLLGLIERENSNQFNRYEEYLYNYDGYDSDLDSKHLGDDYSESVSQEATYNREKGRLSFSEVIYYFFNESKQYNLSIEQKVQLYLTILGLFIVFVAVIALGFLGFKYFEKIGEGSKSQEILTQFAAHPLAIPQSGSFQLASQGTIALLDTKITAKDFGVEVRLYNPYSSLEGGWDYGFVFRSTDKTRNLRLSISNDAKWTLTQQENITTTTVSTGSIENFDKGADGSNVLKLVVSGNKAYLSCNDQYVTTLDVSGRTGQGGLFLAGGINISTLAGKPIKYENLIVYIPKKTDLSLKKTRSSGH